MSPTPNACAASSDRSGAPTILVVDDNTSLRVLLQRALTGARYHVLTAASGRAAREMIAATPVDLVVTDIHMTDGDGLELLAHLRETAPRLPVIVMSAGFRGTNESAARVAGVLGAIKTLEKPFSLQPLLEAVGECLCRPELGSASFA